MDDFAKPGDAEVGIDYVAASADDPSVCIVELDVSSAAYEVGHIPGAIMWNAYTDLRRPGYGRISHAELGELVRRSGIGPASTVVVYGYGAHLGYWLLKSLGHERVKLLDGSRDRWSDAGHALTAAVPAPVPTQYEVPAQERYIASEEDVAAMVDGSRGAILDVRSEAEFSGVDFWPSGAAESKGRRGHVPGAVHIPIAPYRTSDSLFTDVAGLGRILEDLAIDPSDQVVTYCTIGNRASQMWYALTVLLGYHDVRVYYGSWVEWGMQADTPIDTLSV